MLDSGEDYKSLLSVCLVFLCKILSTSFDEILSVDGTMQLEKATRFRTLPTKKEQQGGDNGKFWPSCTLIRLT